MNAPVLSPPPEQARRPAPAGREPMAARPVRRPRDPDRFSRVLRWSLLLSLTVHAVVLLVAGPYIQLRPSPELLLPSAPSPARLAEMEWVVPVPEGAEGEGRPTAATDAPSAATPPGASAAPRREEPTVVRVRPGAATAPAGGAPVESPAGGGGVRDALRPGFRDPRLYVDARRVPLPEKSDHEKYMEHLQARLDAVNDSLYGEAEAARRATDWTVTDKEGRRWGLSPEGLHLGGVTVPRGVLPIPRSTGDSQLQEAERERQRQRDEIRRQEEARERQKTQEERARATRERREAERRRGGGGGS